MTSSIAEASSDASTTTVSGTGARPRAALEAIHSAAPHAAALPFRARAWVAPAMVLADILALQACVAAAFFARQALAPWLPIELHLHHYAGIAAGALILPVIWLLVGLYPGYGVAAPERLRRRVLSTSAIFGVLLAWDHLVQDKTWSRGILLLAWAFATVALPVTGEQAIRALVRVRVWGQPVLLTGRVSRAREVIAGLHACPGLGLVPVGYLTDEGPEDAGPDARIARRQDHGEGGNAEPLTWSLSTGESPAQAAATLATPAIDGVPCLGTTANANRYADDVSTVLVLNSGADAAGANGPDSQLNETALTGLAFPHVVLVPRLPAGVGLWIRARDLGGTAGLEIKKNLLIPHNLRIKRLMDVILAVQAFLFFAPLLALLALAVMAVSPGWPFYVQVREGLEGRRFRILKLRTMYPDAERRLKAHLAANPAAAREWKRHFKLRRDPRILPLIGNFLRKSSLDELPQLLNVLRGEMSLVGPRPFPHYHLESFDPAFRELRRSVLPGLTGLWQVEARSDGDLAVQEALDTEYIRNWSVWLDIWLLARTFAAVARRNGAR